MIAMILKMSGITIMYIVLTIFLWKLTRGKKFTVTKILVLGIIYGFCSVLSTHFAVDFGHMLINLRDLAPLAAGLFFHPAAGVIAGLIGGIERYIVGTYFGIGSYTRIACSVSTCLAGFVALLMNVKVFKGKKPSPVYAFFMGAVMEVFHMYVVFITHRDDMRMAFHVVSICSIPMIIFSGIGLACMAIILQVLCGEWKNPFMYKDEEKISVSQKFQKWLFIVTTLVISVNFAFSYTIQTQSAYQNGVAAIFDNAKEIQERFKIGLKYVIPDSSEFFEIINKDGVVIAGNHRYKHLDDSLVKAIEEHKGKSIYISQIFDERSLNKVDSIGTDMLLLTYYPESELYWYRNAQAYETGLADVLLFTVIYVLIAFLVHQIVVSNIELINDSLDKITNGDLNEVVRVRSSSEFASLSDDINQTVGALKGYIAAAENRIEQELIFAKTIQESSLPKHFEFPQRENDFDIYAAMETAKEVGGDFYDFFFVDRNKLALVIADVSGKGIPAALFMMRSKTAIRSFAESGGSPDEILSKANKALCEGNDAEMFVTVWIGIVDLVTGKVSCANAGHEYPLIQRANGEFELFKDKHTLALAAMEGIKAKEYEMELHPGDKLFVYTDGIPEAINKNEEQYGIDRLLTALNEKKNKSFSEIIPSIFDSVFAFKGEADQFDDITMLGFEFKNYSKN